MFSFYNWNIDFIRVDSCTNNSLFQSVSFISHSSANAFSEQMIFLNDIIFLPAFVSILIMLYLPPGALSLSKFLKNYCSLTDLRFSLFQFFSVLNAMFVLSLFFFIFTNFELSANDFLLFSQAFLSIGAYFIIRWLFIGGIGFLMENVDMSIKYLKYDIEFLLWMGTLFATIFPLAFVGILTHYMRFILLFLIVFLILLRWYYSFKLGMQEKKYGQLMFFLYFCTVEILPLSVMYKLIGVI
ncbi:MAG: DUF4271 domain-containing protein [Bacteroidales bacterium]|nr:DUF4271 domain-containing protein [Bacteroidales bacterium]